MTVEISPPSGATVPSVKTQGGTAAAPTAETIWRFNAPAGDTHGPFTLQIGGAAFGAGPTFDRVMYLGYNQADGGGKVVAAEPSFGMAVESDYDDGIKHNIEAYWEYEKASGATGPATIRPFFLQLDRSNGALHFEINSTAGFSLNTTDGNGTNWGTLGPTGLQFNPLTGQSVGLTLGWVAGGQNFILVGNSTKSLLIQPIAAGNAAWGMQVGGVDAMQFTTGKAAFGDTSIGLLGAITARVLTADKDAANTLQLRAQTAQSTSLLMCKTADDSVFAMSIEVDGRLRGPVSATAAATAYGFIGDTDTGLFRKAANITGLAAGAVAQLFSGNAAPADGDLAAGDIGLWFDKTNGAGKLMVKAKTTDGTVVAGSLALA